MRSPYKASILFKTLFVIIFLCLISENALSQETLVGSNSAFALDLYQELRASDGNLFLSPYSISTALAMTYAGARGETERQIQKVMHFSISQDNLHPAFSKLQDTLEKVQKEGKVQLYIANSIWPNRAYPFTNGYLDLIKKYYKTEITSLDYARQSEKARRIINTWVEDKTRSKIKEIIQPGILNALTRLVLVNAIYFKGKWKSQFDRKHTSDTLFKVSRDRGVKTPMMYQIGPFGYWEDKDLQVLEMPYKGHQLSMIVLLPKKIEGLPQLEEKLNSENLKIWTSQLCPQRVETWLPKFRITYNLRLDETLKKMGMVDAFGDNADFSGMDGTDVLFISAVFHKAFIDLNEEGTEAAATTFTHIVGQSKTSRPRFRADHPFVFLIKENQTGSILFLGRVIDPTKTG